MIEGYVGVMENGSYYLRFRLLGEFPKNRGTFLGGPPI